MNLVRTSLLNGVAVVTKLGTSLVLNKVLAVYVGPTGYAVIGQFQSLVSMATTFASGGVNTGVIKYTAEYAGDLPRQQAVWRSAATLGLVGTGILGLVLVILRVPLARWALGDEQLASVILWLALSLALVVLNGLLLAILNGRKAVRSLVIANVLGSLAGAALATALVMRLELYGALLALAIGPCIAFAFTAWLFRRECRIRWRSLFGRIDPTVARALGGYALMTATTALVVPLSHMVIRDRIAADLGWASAGLWQALWKISEVHLLLLTTTLSVYFLPRFAEIRSPVALRREVLLGYRFVLPLVATSGLCLYFFRAPLVRGLLSAEFLPLVDVLGLQLLGDVLKILSWVMAFTMVSHARTRAFIVTETLFAALLTASTVWLAGQLGLRGAAAAYVLTYAVYLVTMYVLFGGLVARLQRDAETAALADATTP